MEGFFTRAAHGTTDNFGMLNRTDLEVALLDVAREMRESCVEGTHDVRVVVVLLREAADRVPMGLQFAVHLPDLRFVPLRQLKFHFFTFWIATDENIT